MLAVTEYRALLFWRSAKNKTFVAPVDFFCSRRTIWVWKFQTATPHTVLVFIQSEASIMANKAVIREYKVIT